VPLSGGLDSRAVLATLLEFVPAERIQTYTFGSRGSADFELGNRVARHLGTRHTELPMDELPLGLDDLIEISQRTYHQTRLFLTPPILEIDARFRGSLVWSGFMGGEAAGEDLPYIAPTSIDRAKAYLLDHCTVSRSVDLCGADLRSLYPLLEPSDPQPPDRVSYVEQIGFEHESLKLTAPHMLWAGNDYACPFLDPELFGLMMSVGYRRRIDRRFFRRFLLTTYTELFEIPSKTYEGLPLSASSSRLLARKARRHARAAANVLYPCFADEGLNYIDFERRARSSAEFRELLRGSLSDLAGRGIVDWIDLEGLWKARHFWRRRHLAAIMLLASLEIHLKAGMTLSAADSPAPRAASEEDPAARCA
jgi:hypothetical protein